MPNGISCAFFAGRNFVYGKSEKNIFKEGIGCAQTLRTAEKVIESSSSVASKVSSPLKSACSTGARLAEKIVYPLIIGSGIYNTLKSDDKVKTGIMQASGIGTMFAFEQVASKALKSIEKNIIKNDFISHSKYSKIVWPILKGLCFVTASLSGYNVGSSGGENIVQKARAKRNAKKQQNISNEKQPNSESLYIPEVKDIDQTLCNVFEDIKLK